MARNNRALSVGEIKAEEDALTNFQFAVIDAMAERGITQSQFAEMLGVSRARISQLLSPSANPTLKLTGRALDAVGLQLAICPKVKATPASELAFHKGEATVSSWAEVFVGTPSRVKREGRRMRHAGRHVACVSLKRVGSWARSETSAANENYAEQPSSVDAA